MPQNSPKAGYSIVDYSGEVSTLSGYIEQPTAANLPALLTDIGTMRGAIEGITLGIVQREFAQVTNTKLTGDVPTDPDAQRERKWLVIAVDTLEFLDQVNAVLNPYFGETFTMEIPTAKFHDDTEGDLLVPGTDLADPTNPLIVAFVDAYEDMFRSKSIGTPQVLEMRAVGRAT